MSNRLHDVVNFIADCEHKTAPAARAGEEFAYSIGTPNLRQGRIMLGTAKRIDRATFDAWTQRGTPQSGDLILAREAPVGQVGLVPDGENVCLGQRTVLIRPNLHRVNPRYLQYLLLSSPVQQWMIDRASGSTVAHLNVADVRDIELGCLHDRNQQDAIAEVLGALDDKIDANARLVPLLRDLAKAVLRRAADPATWHVVGDVAEVRKGLSYTGAGLAETGMPMVNLANAENFGWLKRSGFKHYTGAYKPRHVAPPGALLISGVEQTWRHEIIGWPMLLPDDVGPALFSHHVFRVDFRPERAWLRLPLWAHLYTADARARLEGMVYGTTVATLPTEALTGLEFPAPPEDAPALEAAADLLRRAWIAERESAWLAALRDTLLPPLLSGELRVRDAEAVLADAT